MGAFKAYDIRGVYDQDFNKEDVYRIGFFLPELLGAKKVLVGRDVRLSSPEIHAYLCKGIEDAGADAYDLGICTTPMVYWATAQYGFEASVMITASHNPKEYNGLKISKRNALPVGYDTGLGELERWLKERVVVPVSRKGKTVEFDKRNDYLAFQRQWLSDGIGNLRIAMDCSNGMASVFVHDLYGNRPVYLYDTLDGTFPNHEANPLDPANTEDIRNLVRETKADIGVIFDGDADDDSRAWRLFSKRQRLARKSAAGYPDLEVGSGLCGKIGRHNGDVAGGESLCGIETERDRWYLWWRVGWTLLFSRLQLF